MTVLCLAACAEGGGQVGSFKRSCGTFMGRAREDACESAGVASGLPERVSVHGYRVAQVTVQPLPTGTDRTGSRILRPCLEVGEGSASGQGSKVYADFRIASDSGSLWREAKKRPPPMSHCRTDSGCWRGRSPELVR